MGANDSFHAALRAASSPRVWRVIGTVALAASGWLTWTVHSLQSAPAPAPAAPAASSSVPVPPEVAIAALAQRMTAAEQSSLACREQTALALQEMIGLHVDQSARGNQSQRAAASAAAQRRFKRALLAGSTFAQATAEAVGGAD